MGDADAKNDSRKRGVRGLGGIEVRPWVGSSSMRAKALFTSPSLLRQSVSACNDLARCYNTGMFFVLFLLGLMNYYDNS